MLPRTLQSGALAVVYGSLSITCGLKKILGNCTRMGNSLLVISAIHRTVQMIEAMPMGKKVK